jgi:diaminopropionate ammonia-lyase
MKDLYIKFVANAGARRDYDKKVSVGAMARDKIYKVKAFHESFPQYKTTPLHSLDNLAKVLGVKGIFVKDESYRFGLNAFKVLGGAYAIGKYLAKVLGVDIEELSFDRLRSKDIKKKLGDITFVTATDGNHGRGVAWAAHQLGQRSVVFMPKGSSKIRLQNIKNEGAEAFITEYNYDESVKLATKYAKEHDGIVVQDTAWEGYEDIPLWIMQGYGTLIHEALEQMEALGNDGPTHVFLQAGVGSFAGAVQGYLAALMGNNRPITVIVEPDQADCIYRSAKAGDGKPHAVKGDLSTIMSGLACGEPNTISWEILRDYSDMFVSCPDSVAARGVRILASPLKGDPQVVSGESGAVGIGLLSLIMEREDLKEMKDLLKLAESSTVLFISTEGDTDPMDYRRIVWDGAYSL